MYTDGFEGGSEMRGVGLGGDEVGELLFLYVFFRVDRDGGVVP